MTDRLDPPAFYDDTRRAIWADAITRLQASGRIFTTDPRLLDTYVQAAADHADAVQLRTQSGGHVATTRDGHVIEHPLLAIQRNAATELAKTSKALGLDRAALPPMARDPTASPMARTGRWCEDHHRYECTKQRNKGGPCHGSPVRGLDTCKNHGGKTLTDLKLDGEVRLARIYGTPIDVTPADGLLREVQWSAGHVEALRKAVLELEAGGAGQPGGSLWWGTVKTISRDGVIERTEQAVPHVILQAYSAERAHFARVCQAAIAGGAMQQAVDQAKTVGVMVAQLLDAVCARLFSVPALPDAVAVVEWQRAQLPLIVPEVLAGLGPGEAAS